VPAQPCRKFPAQSFLRRSAVQQSGAAFHPIVDEIVIAASDRPTGGRNEPAKFEWPALLRKLDRIDPSYKQ
jgi:hypothetical protein